MLWRGYAANGSGVSLEFNPFMFASISGPDSPSKGLMRLWRVFYDEPTQESIMRDAVQFGLAKPGTAPIAKSILDSAWRGDAGSVLQPE